MAQEFGDLLRKAPAPSFQPYYYNAQGDGRSEAIAGNADSNMAPRWPLIRIMYLADAGPMHRSSGVTR